MPGPEVSSSPYPPALGKPLPSGAGHFFVLPTKPSQTAAEYRCRVLACTAERLARAEIRNADTRYRLLKLAGASDAHRPSRP